MVARRLLIVLLVLLGISTVGVLLAPQHETDKEPGTTEAQPPPVVRPGDIDRLLKATIDADDPEITVVPLQAGDQLRLSVQSRKEDQVEVPAFGLIDAASRDAPASFDLLLEKPGTYAVRLVSNNRVVGKLEVTPAAQPEPAQAP